MRPLIVAALAATGLTLAGPAPAAHAEVDPTPADIGADWLDGELTNGVIHDEQWDFDDYGATVEAAYALDAVGRTDSIAAITTALETNAEAYTAPGEDVWAGSTGKLLSYVTDLAPAADPSAFGGLDLVQQLEARTEDSGRISDASQFGDFSNSFGQAWAVRGLTNAGSEEADAAVDFLLKQQCAAGFFRLNWSAPDQTCDQDAPPVPPVDTAATVVILTWDLQAAHPTLTPALASAVAWIKTQQAENGSFSGGSATEGANANSTGLAGRALQLGGETEAAAEAAAWIRARQVAGLGCDGALAPERGAIGYDDAALAEGRTEGIDVPSAGQWRFALIQALPALLAAPESAADLRLSGVPAFLDGGSARRITVSGLAPGERGCARIAGSSVPVVGDADGTVVANVPVPNRTRRVTVAVAVADQGVATETVALAAKRLPLDLRSWVERRGTQRVVVSGLWAGERVVVKHDGRVVVRGRATSGGGFVASFGVGRKTGRHTVAVTGQFPDRSTRAAFRVAG